MFENLVIIRNKIQDQSIKLIIKDQAITQTKFHQDV